MIMRSIEIALSAGCEIRATGAAGVTVIDRRRSSRWEVDLAEQGYVSVIGAVILTAQPPPVESMELAAMLAFGAPWKFVEGLRDGLADDLSDEEVRRDPMDLYAFGAQVGHLVLAELRRYDEKTPALALEDPGYETPSC